MDSRPERFDTGANLSSMTDDPIDLLGDPNCPTCLEPMDAVVGGWWCEECGVTGRPADAKSDTLGT